MKLSNDKTPIEAQLVNPVKQFQIKTNAKAFQILSSQLYQDKLLAIIRELSANAYDAHVMVGREDVPFEITVPNNFATELQIKDFGPGLSEEDIFSLYTTYFDSNKTDSNALMGGFGLGSKTPFSYTNTFTVESRFDGKIKTYIAFVDEHGTPSITKIGESPLTKDTGLTVKIPIKQGDISSLKGVIEKNLFLYDPLPIVHNADPEYPLILYSDTIGDDYGWLMTNMDLDKYDYGRTSSGVTLNYNNDLIFSSCAVCMGKIIYKASVTCSSNDIASAFSPTELDKFRSGRTVFSNIVMEFPIGSLDLTPSREAVSFDPKTKQTFLKGFLKIYKAVTRYVKEELDSKITALPALHSKLGVISQLNSSKILDTSLRHELTDRVIGEYLDEYSLRDLKTCSLSISRYSGDRYRISTGYLRNIENSDLMSINSFYRKIFLIVLDKKADLSLGPSYLFYQMQRDRFTEYLKSIGWDIDDLANGGTGLFVLEADSLSPKQVRGIHNARDNLKLKIVNMSKLQKLIPLIKPTATNRRGGSSVSRAKKTTDKYIFRPAGTYQGRADFFSEKQAIGIHQDESTCLFYVPTTQRNIISDKYLEYLQTYFRAVKIGYDYRHHPKRLVLLSANKSDYNELVTFCKSRNIKNINDHLDALVKHLKIFKIEDFTRGYFVNSSSLIYEPKMTSAVETVMWGAVARDVDSTLRNDMERLRAAWFNWEPPEAVFSICDLAFSNSRSNALAKQDVVTTSILQKIKDEVNKKIKTYEKVTELKAAFEIFNEYFEANNYSLKREGNSDARIIAKFIKKYTGDSLNV